MKKHLRLSRKISKNKEIVRACRSGDLKRIYRLFEEKKRCEAEEAKALAEAWEREAREAEEVTKRARKKAEKKIVAEEPAEEIKEKELVVEESQE